MNDLQVFTNEKFGEVRAILIDGMIYLVGRDVALALGYKNTRKALADHVDDEDKKDGVTIRDSIGRMQTPVLINESGFYSLILSSKLPQVKEFKRWITSEVLPAIRKTGFYQNKSVTIIDALDQTLQVLRDHERRVALIENSQNEQIARLNKIEEENKQIRRDLNPPSPSEPVADRYNYTNGLINSIVRNSDLTYGDVWQKIIAELYDTHGIDVQHELRQIKTDLHRLYRNECIRLGSSRKVPKTIIRPYMINQLTVNKIISSNIEWYQTTVELLKKMQNEKQKIAS